MPRLREGARRQTVGAADRLYRVAGRAGPLVDRSRGGLPYAAAAARPWRFVQFRDRFLATCRPRRE